MEYLFITGCARSGTTDLTRFVNCHPDIFIGSERYIYLYNKPDSITPELFRYLRFSSIKPGETFWTNLSDMPDWDTLGKNRLPKVQIAGDKAPFAIFYLKDIRNNLPTARFLITVRDVVSVARSWGKRSRDVNDVYWPRTSDFDAGVRYWIDCMRILCAYVGDRFPVTDIYMPHLFQDDRVELTRLLDTLKVSLSPEMEAHFANATNFYRGRPATEPTEAEKLAVLRDMGEIFSVMQHLSRSQYRLPLTTLFWPDFMADLKAANLRFKASQAAGQS